MVSVLTQNNQQNNSVSPVMDVELNSFGDFLRGFPLQGDELYKTVFKRNSDVVQTQKAHVAIVNLEKILKATFDVSAESGFDRMSLRDLSRQTGMSMGAIYSCISKKEDIALMVADIVRLSSEMTRDYAQKSNSPWTQIEQSIRYHLYASTILQPWYFFLYFETRSLPEQQQLDSKRIELDAIESFEQQINAGISAGHFQADNPQMIANMIVVLLEDWYLKPWKTHALPMLEKRNNTEKRSSRLLSEQEHTIKHYNQAIIGLVKKQLAVKA